MSSHVARLKEELDAKQHELHEQQATVDSIEKLTRELEAKKEALAAKAAEVNARQNEVTAMQHRLEALETIDLAINEAMHTKSGTQDVMKQIIENAIRSDHVTGSEILQIALNTAIAVNGRTRSDNLGDFLMDLIVDEGSLKAAIDSAIQNLGVNDAVKYILAAVIGHGLSPHHLVECIKKTMEAMAAEKPAVMDSWGCAKEKQESPKVKLPPVRQPTNTPVNTNGLRGQAADFKPLKDPEQKYSARGWQALAQSSWGNGTGGW